LHQVSSLQATGSIKTESVSCPKATASSEDRPRRPTSPEGLVQQVAVSYLRHGYWFYVTGRIKPDKDPALLDQKLITKHGNWFVLLATEGHHAFKQQERNQIRDCRRHPIRFEGYSISYRRSPITPKGGGEPKWHACVRIDGPTYKQLKSYFLDRAVHRNAKSLSQDFARVPYARYAPVRRQLLNILRAVNKARSKQRFDELLPSSVKLKRAIVRPFEPESI